MNRILLLDPQSPELRRIASLLEKRGYLPTPVADLATLHQQVDGDTIILCDVRHQAAALAEGTAPVILLDGEASIAAAVRAIKAGAADYLPAEADDQEVLAAVRTALAERPPVSKAFPMVGMSKPMQDLAASIAKVAPTDSTVLITGESGTGKELAARALHAGSRRRYAPLISLNCATVPHDLIEMELFGHPGDERGGLLATADGGTLFLDEIGELPAAAQSRLLRALESKPDIRLIVATHRDLDSLVANGQFRGDLYYRLKVIALPVPPLRDRGEDILLLADELLTRTMEKLGKSGLTFAERTRADMCRYRWPGNVRELENAIQRAVILRDSGEIETEALAIEPPRAGEAHKSQAGTPDQTIEDYFVSFVTAHQDTMTETELAEKLGISRKSLWERRQRLNIPRMKTRKRGRRRDVS